MKLDESKIESLAAMHATIAEIAAEMGCSRDTLERNYAAIMAKGRDRGKMTLRHYMWKAAKAGNVVMMIWLSKNHLGMSDTAPAADLDEKRYTVAWK